MNFNSMILMPFFLSLLDILRREKFQVSQGIEISEIFVEMLANAWYPHNYFKSQTYNILLEILYK